MTTLESLISRIEQEGKTKDLLENAKPASQDKKEQLAALNNLNRLSPAVPFLHLQGQLKYPVIGTKLKDFGSSDELGSLQKGLSLASEPQAQVQAPSDGWVVYSGPFRSYGKIIILNVGQGFHILLAGLDKISVDQGQFVLNGEPIGQMGQVSTLATLSSLKSEKPILYIEFKKDGQSINPAAWWANSSIKEGTKS